MKSLMNKAHITSHMGLAWCSCLFLRSAMDSQRIPGIPMGTWTPVRAMARPFSGEHVFACFRRGTTDRVDARAPHSIQHVCWSHELPSSKLPWAVYWLFKLNTQQPMIFRINLCWFNRGYVAQDSIFCGRSQSFVSEVKTCLSCPNYLVIQDVRGVNAAIDRSSMPAYFGWYTEPNRTHKCQRVALTSLAPSKLKRKNGVCVWTKGLDNMNPFMKSALPCQSLVFKCSAHSPTEVEPPQVPQE